MFVHMRNGKTTSGLSVFDFVANPLLLGNHLAAHNPCSSLEIDQFTLVACVSILR